MAVAHNVPAATNGNALRSEPGSVAAGDFVLVHVGYAIQSISTQDADASWALFDQITAGLDHQNA